MNALNSKLTAMVKIGSLNQQEAEIILKQASQNPANVLNHLDVPSYHHRVGSIAKEASSTEKTDPLYDFCFGT